MFEDPLPDWLNRRSLGWPIALGAVMGLGLGAIALFDIGGMLGVALGVVVLALVVWLAVNAEPVLVADRQNNHKP